MSQKETNNLLWVGTIVNTHGVKGEVRILSDSDDKDKIFTKGTKLFTQGSMDNELTISASRPHKQFILTTFEGKENINDIEYLKGERVYIVREELEDGEYYLNDLIGLPVYDQGDKLIGTISSILNQGPYESIVVDLENNKTTNIPFVDEFKIEYNQESKKVYVELPDGYIED